MDRVHPPLRRVTRGEPLRVDPTLPKEPIRQEHSFREPREPLRAEPSTNSAESRDSCYSSCSEESHSSLSRESSGALSRDFNQLSIDEGLLDATTPTHSRQIPDEILNFARSLGFREDQVHRALESVGYDAGQDKVLAELVKHGGCADTVRAGRARTVDECNKEPEQRPIVIDGSNIAMTHGRKEVFSCYGIRECVKFFEDRGHRDILVVIPNFRKEAPRSDCPITDQHILLQLDLEQKIVWTPSRRINGRRIVCHDDRYILKTAEEKDAVIVSNDEYRDLVRENPQYMKLVESRLLMYSFVDGKFMPPDDPLGRQGPTLDQFLSKHSAVNQTTQLCPYARKCTYGNKCKYLHPERPNGTHISVPDRLMKDRNQKRTVQSRPSMQYEMYQNPHNSVSRTKSLQLGQENNYPIAPRPQHLPIARHWSTNTSMHSPVGRNQSMPVGGQTHMGGPIAGMAGQMGGSGSASLLDENQMYVPSTSIWGHSELSVAPLGQPSSMNPERARIQFSLCNLFPESIVSAVMAAYPNEMNSQVLCEHIIAMNKEVCGRRY